MSVNEDAQIPRRVRDGSSALNRSDHDRRKLSADEVGRWQVETVTATYVLDLDERQARRVPAAATPAAGWRTAALRQDYAPLPLFALEQCEVGQPMVLLLSVAPPAVTIRETTPVRRIVALP